MPNDERAQILAFDELEQERRAEDIKAAGDKLTTETLLAWLYHEG